MINRMLWEQYMQLADQLIIPGTLADMDYLGEPQDLVCKVLRRAGLACGQPELPADPDGIIKAIDLAVIGLSSEDQEALLLIVDILKSEVPWPLQLWSHTIPPQQLVPDRARCVGVFAGDLGPWPPERMDEAQKLEVHMATLGMGLDELPSHVLTRAKKDNEEDDEG